MLSGVVITTSEGDPCLTFVISVAAGKSVTHLHSVAGRLLEHRDQLFERLAHRGEPSSVISAACTAVLIMIGAQCAQQCRNDCPVAITISPLLDQNSRFDAISAPSTRRAAWPRRPPDAPRRPRPTCRSRNRCRRSPARARPRRRTGDPLRHQFRMLDQMDAMRHYARHDDLVVRQLHVLPHRPFVLVARVGAPPSGRPPARTCSIRSTKCLSSKSCTRGAMLML